MDTRYPGRLQDLAMRIYVELVARNTEFQAGSVKMNATAANIATLSLRLSEAFLQTEAEAIAARQPAKSYQVGSDDLAKWTK